MAKKSPRRPKSKKSAPKKKTASSKKPAAKNSFKINPLGDRVVVRPLSQSEAGTQRPSGIFIPETADKERSHEGTVVAVGPGTLVDGVRIPLSVKAGDKVMFSAYGYDEVKVDGQEYFIVKEEHILAIIH